MPVLQPFTIIRVHVLSLSPEKNPPGVGGGYEGHIRPPSYGGWTNCPLCKTKGGLHYYKCSKTGAILACCKREGCWTWFS